MTVRELIRALKRFDPEATVFTSDDDGDTIRHVVDVTPSDDAPDEEVYLEVTL